VRLAHALLLLAYLEWQRHAHLALAGVAQQPQRHAKRVLSRIAGRVVDRVAGNRAQLDQELRVHVLEVMASTRSSICSPRPPRASPR